MAYSRIQINEASSLAMKVKVDDENDDNAKAIKNSDLNSKLDKILDILENKKKIDKQCIKPFTTESGTEESEAEVLQILEGDHRVRFCV